MYTSPEKILRLRMRMWSLKAATLLGLLLVALWTGDILSPAARIGIALSWLPLSLFLAVIEEILANRISARITREIRE